MLDNVNQDECFNQRFKTLLILLISSSHQIERKNMSVPNYTWVHGRAVQVQEILLVLIFEWSENKEQTDLLLAKYFKLAAICQDDGRPHINWTEPISTVASGLSWFGDSFVCKKTFPKWKVEFNTDKIIPAPKSGFGIQYKRIYIPACFHFPP